MRNYSKKKRSEERKKDEKKKKNNNKKKKHKRNIKDKQMTQKNEHRQDKFMLACFRSECMEAFAHASVSHL